MANSKRSKKQVKEELEIAEQTLKALHDELDEIKAEQNVGRVFVDILEPDTVVTILSGKAKNAEAVKVKVVRKTEMTLKVLESSYKEQTND